MLGSLTLERDVPAGTKLWLAAWTNTDDEGQKWIAIRASFPEERQSGNYAPRQIRQNPPDDDIPF